MRLHIKVKNYKKLILKMLENISIFPYLNNNYLLKHLNNIFLLVNACLSV